MRILLLADIHANLPALNAVLEAGESLDCDAIWCLGDIVGYGPFPNECARLIQKRAAHVIRGNHDVRAMVEYPRQEKGGRKKEEYKVFVFKWTHGAFTPDVRQYLGNLPLEIRLEVGGKNVLMVHGSPHGIRDGITPYTSPGRLLELSLAAKADIVLVGHTHDAFLRQAGPVTFINPGSVGRPFDTDPRASFMVLDISARGVQAKAHRIPYDMAAVELEMRRQNFPEVLILAFAEARSPADVVLPGIRGDMAGAALAAGEHHAVDRAHARHVAMLALRLFDALQPLHGYGLRERGLLQAGALLHDAGMARGGDDHHKSSRDIILEDTLLPVSERERIVVALIARYHRRSLPRPGHKYFSELPDHHKLIVERLGGMVRLADGLDRSHQGLVKDIDVEILPDAVCLKLLADGPIENEIAAGKMKGDLFTRAFGKSVQLISSGIGV